MTRSVRDLHRLSLVVERRLGGGVVVERYIRLVVVHEGINLRQCGRRLPHVELAGNDIGDEARAVFAEEVDFGGRTTRCPVQSIGRLGDSTKYGQLIVQRRKGNWKRT